MNEGILGAAGLIFVSVETQAIQVKDLSEKEDNIRWTAAKTIHHSAWEENLTLTSFKQEQARQNAFFPVPMRVAQLPAGPPFDLFYK